MSISTATTAQLDQLIAALRDGERGWAAESLASRRDLLLQVHANVAAHAEEWVRVAGEIKQLPAGSPLLGEEWISGPWAVARLRRGAGRHAGPPGSRAGTCWPGTRSGPRPAAGSPSTCCRTTSSTGCCSAASGPRSGWSPASPSRRPREPGRAGLRTPEQTAGVAVVLGAGNIFSIAPLDVLYQLYAAQPGRPAQAQPGHRPAAAGASRPSSPRSSSAATCASSPATPTVGDHLVTHPGVDAVHITGSEATHDAIVWGTGDDGRRGEGGRHPAPDQADHQRTRRRVARPSWCPGSWSKADLPLPGRAHRHPAPAQQRLQLHRRPDRHRQRRLAAEATSSSPRCATRSRPRPPDPPGTRAASQRWPTRGARTRRFEAVGGTPERTLLWGLDLRRRGRVRVRHRVLRAGARRRRTARHRAEFLDAAVDAANERLHGTLGANLIVDPRHQRPLGGGLREAIAQLRYGTIGVNAWTGVGYLTARATWGAFPGHPLDDIGSGRGVVHNALLLHRPERTVVYGPFRPMPRSVMTGEFSLTPKPPWFVTNRTAATTGRRLTEFAARPRWTALIGIFTSALRG